MTTTNQAGDPFAVWGFVILLLAAIIAVLTAIVIWLLCKVAEAHRRHGPSRDAVEREMLLRSKLR